MKRLPRVFMLAIIFSTTAACTVVEDTVLAEEMAQFARGVMSLSDVVSQQFELAEEINTLGFTENLLFQLDLGGNPGTDLKPLFSTRDIAARENLLSALEGYAAGLAALGSGNSPEAIYAKMSGTAQGLKTLTSDSFSLSHSLSFLQSDQLVDDLGLFDQFFLLPERDRRLAPILDKGGKSLKKAALLLYFDIGATADQSGKCNFTVPANDLEADMSSLKLCRGGLRSIIATAVAFDVTVWKDRLSYRNSTGAGGAADRREAVTRLVGMQKLGQTIDKLLAETQSAMIAMVAAHKTMEAAFGHDQTRSSLSAPLMASSRTLLFVDQATALSEKLQTVKSAIVELSANTSAVSAVQVVPQRTPRDDEKQQEMDK